MSEHTGLVPTGDQPPSSASWPTKLQLTLMVVTAATSVILFCFPWLVHLDGVTPFVQLVAWRVPIVTVLGPLVVAVLLVSYRFPTARRRVLPAGTVLLVVTVVAAATVVPRAVPASSALSGGQPFRVLSLNVDNGEADVSSLAATIRGTEPDVVVLPEAGERYASALLGALAGLGYQAASAGPPGLSDGLSVSVLLAPGLRGDRSDREGIRFWWLRISGGTLPVDLLAVHVAAPVPEQAWKWTADMTGLTGPCGTGRPVLVVGDFNSTVDSHGFAQMSNGCRDAAAASGQGLVGTWPAWLPGWLGMQIDHILVGGSVKVDNTVVLTSPGTDHRALLANLRVPIAHVEGG